MGLLKEDGVVELFYLFAVLLAFFVNTAFLVLENILILLLALLIGLEHPIVFLSNLLPLALGKTILFLQFLTLLLQH